MTRHAGANELRNSVRATYDSRHTGPRYWVTTEIDGQAVEFRTPIPDPFIRKTIEIEWRWFQWLRWPRRRVTITVCVGADRELMDDVLELDENALVSGRTRKAAFRQALNERLRTMDTGEVS